MNIGDRIQICKLVALAILSDAQLKDSEQRYIDDLMNRFELNDEQRREALSCNIDDDPVKIAAAIGEGEARNQLCVELVMVVAADGEIAASERRLLDSIAETLSIADEDLEKMIAAAIC